MWYVLRRLIHTLFLLVGVSVLSFLFAEFAPGDYFEQMKLNPQISQETVASLRAKYDLNEPLPIRYAQWVRSVLRGEFGFSFAYNAPVAPLILARSKNTLLLTGTATLLAWLFAVPLGVWAAAQKGKWPDRILAAGTTALLATSDLLLALLLLVVAIRTGWFPTGGMQGQGISQLTGWEKAKDFFSHLFLPTLCLVLSALPIMIRHVRAALLEVLDSPFVRAACGHGIPRQRLLFRHALPAAANPLISLFGFSVATLLSGSLLIEVIMSWPGIGPMLLEAILTRDLYLVIGVVMFSTFFLAGGNLLADLLLYVADPRIRTE